MIGGQLSITALKRKHPEDMDGSIIQYTLMEVHEMMMVGFHERPPPHGFHTNAILTKSVMCQVSVVDGDRVRHQQTNTLDKQVPSRDQLTPILNTAI